MVPEVGFEPTRAQSSGDFESPVSSIPPLRRQLNYKKSLISCQT